MLPNFLIIGAPRSGTTWMAKNLQFHPQIFMPEKKEVHYFDRNYDKGLSFYERYFKAARSEIRTGEASPSYFQTKEAPARIKKHLGSIKLIVCLRNPVDRLYSRFLNVKATYKHNRDVSFEEKIRSKPEFIYEGFYHDHFERYLEYFSLDDFLVLFYEDLQNDSRQFMQTMLSFLEVEDSFIPPRVDHTINSARSKGLLGKSKSLYYLSLVSKRLRLLGLSNRFQQINSREMPVVANETKKWLIEEYYQMQILKLQDLLKCDLSHWNTIN